MTVRAIVLSTAVWTSPLFAGDDHGHAHDAPPKSPAASQAETRHTDDDEHAHDHENEVTLSDDEIRTYHVRVGTAQRRPLLQVVSAPGRVAVNVNAMAHVGSALVGRVIEVNAKLGDAVKSGDVLAVVESPELAIAQHDYVVKQATAAAAGPAVELAKQATERAQKLAESQGISAAELAKRQTELLTVEAALRATIAEARAAGGKLSLLGMTDQEIESLATTGKITTRLRLVAPIEGRVTLQPLSVGQWVAPGAESQIVVANLTRPWVIAAVPEFLATAVTVGAEARVAFPGGPAGAEGKVALISPTIDAGSRTVRVSIELDPLQSPPPIGAFAEVQITPAAAGRPVLVIPETAIHTIDGAPVVFVPVPGEHNTFAKRPIAVGRRVGGAAHVLLGLKEGEALVVSGGFIMKADLGKAGAAHQH